MASIYEYVVLIGGMIFLFLLPIQLKMMFVYIRTNVKSKRDLIDATLTMMGTVEVMPFIITLVYFFSTIPYSEIQMFFMVGYSAVGFVFLYTFYSSYKKYKLAKKSELLEKEYNHNLDKD